MSKREGASKPTHHSRKVLREAHAEISQDRTTHRRRKFLARTGVLAGFALTMVVYPAVGTIAPYADASESGGAATVADGGHTVSSRAIIGAQQLDDGNLPLPSVNGASAVLAVSAEFSASSHLPDCDPSVGAEGYNGRMSEDSMCALDNGVLLRNDAAVALAELSAAFELEFGRALCVGNGYRTLSEQYATKASRGYLAAQPGYSVHGWGLAIDLCGDDDTGYTKAWLESHGSTWGWVNPSWAKSSKWEPWHWEYEPGTDELGVYDAGYWSSSNTYYSNRG
ncbi:M15 family metallopeptidase [Demequina sediminicola]|uniref:M15 family metallopeptidase n=1 Tax=Demequina sediminicola TaxID=1095026 RepID=UPI0007805B1C|nr:M15 family metallopeptidase [Demequina sediminicola]